MSEHPTHPASSAHDTFRTGSLRPAALQLGHRPAWRALPLVLLALGTAALGAAWAVGHTAPQRLLFAYLTSFVFWLTIALGALFFVVLQFAVKAGWSVVLRRLAEHALAPLWLFALLFVPIALGHHELYHWSDAAAVASDALLQGKAPYLNLPFFLARALVYFAVWIGIGQLYFRRSIAQDRTGALAVTGQLQRTSGVALLLFALTLTFAAFDWVMSLDPHWYSTIFGAYLFAGCVVAICAFLPLVALLLQRAGALRQLVTVEHYHDLGKLLFAFTVFWAYIAFSQFMLTWYANLPEETVWYARRIQGPWRTLSLVLVLGHFVVPFFFLMTRLTKRRRVTLLGAAVWLLLVHYLDLAWLILPQYPGHDRAVPGLLELLTACGVGGFYLAFFSASLRRHALIPQRDPRLVESLSFENV